MPEIQSLPDKIRIPFDRECNLLDALLGCRIPIVNLCGGMARCSTCRVRIVEGLTACTPRSPDEEQIAQRLNFPDEIRLACQTKASGAVTLQRLVLDQEDERLASQLAQHPAAGLVGRDAELAVLFADVAGYTAMAAALPAYDTIHLLNRFFCAAERVITAAGGKVDNYMGDAVMALFGCGGEAEPALGAVRAGLGLLDVARDLSSYLEALYDRSFSIRVGVHYGPVVVGALGGAKTQRVTAIGDAVNVASRVESAGKETGAAMLVSDEVRGQVGKAVEFGQTFEVSLRGKRGEFTVHEVVGPASV